MGVFEGLFRSLMVFPPNKKFAALDDEGSQRAAVSSGDSRIDNPDLAAEASHGFQRGGYPRRVGDDHMLGSQVGQDPVHLLGHVFFGD